MKCHLNWSSIMIIEGRKLHFSSMMNCKRWKFLIQAMQPLSLGWQHYISKGWFEEFKIIIQWQLLVKPIQLHCQWIRFVHKIEDLPRYFKESMLMKHSNTIVLFHQFILDIQVTIMMLPHTECFVWTRTKIR